MRLVTLSGGLGNQMFQYAFYLGMKKRYTNVFLDLRKIYSLNEHNGYELDKVFSISLSSRERCLVQLLMIPILRNIVKHLLFIKKYRERIYYSFDSNSNIYHKVFFDSWHFVGYWQSEKYFENVIPQVKDYFKFNEEKTNELTGELIKELKSNKSSVSIHIRRNDYLSPRFYENYGGICDEDYYARSIQYINERIKNPIFYVFTDSMDWAKEHLKMENVVFVDWNKGADSWQDMYLMSQCANNIIANSSFSWWGAWLNNNPDKIVIAPSKWINTQAAEDAAPISWVRI